MSNTESDGDASEHEVWSADADADPDLIGYVDRTAKPDDRDIIR